MTQEEEKGIDKMGKTSIEFNREYMHSISRIGDRLKVLRRDLNNLREDVVRDLLDMEEDTRMLSDAFDSFFGDYLNQIHDDERKHEVEEV